MKLMFVTDVEIRSSKSKFWHLLFNVNLKFFLLCPLCINHIHRTHVTSLRK